MNARPLLLGIALFAFVALVVLAPARGVPLASAGPITITAFDPSPNSTVSSSTPTIQAGFADTAGTVNPAAVYIIVDGANVTSVQTVNVTATSVSYTPPTILKLANGPHNVTVDVSDTSGHRASLTWNFTVNTNLTTTPNPLSGIKPGTIILYIAIGAAVAGGIVGGYILFLRQTARFTFRRYFAENPVERTYLVLYLPLGVAFIFLLVALDWAFNTPGLPPRTPDYVIIVTIFIALTAWGIDSRREMLRIRAYERAFAQFLFEMADAMRGGIDPAKAITELAKTHTNILRKNLRVAADGVRMGRAFDVVLRDMVSPMKSKLISRYAGLIADATAFGGETSTVVYRAAKDMDDFVKIEEEREKQLLLPVAVIYIAFGVLMAVLFALLYIAPELGTLNISVLGFGSTLSSNAAKSSGVPVLAFTTLEERFFELMVINALGTGAIIGAFTEGRARYGILHSLGLVAATAIAFAIIFP